MSQLRTPPPTLDGFLALSRNRIDRLDARLLVQEICGLSHAQIIAAPETRIAPPLWQQLLQLLERRASGEPLAYLLGHTDFLGRRFILTPDVLIPRPETEELVALALEKLRQLPEPRCCADLGTGSGIIAISLKLECPQAEIHAVDLSSAALAVARENAQRLRATIAFHPGNWYQPLAGQSFGLIVSNPPYIAAGDPHLSQNGLAHEPPMALTDQSDGLAHLRLLIAGAPLHLTRGGWLLLEHGYDQGESVRRLLAASGFEYVFTHTDLSGNDRISGGMNP